MKYQTPAVGSINLGQAHQESGIAVRERQRRLKGVSGLRRLSLARLSPA
jgi:hypothetical protein